MPDTIDNYPRLNPYAALGLTASALSIGGSALLIFTLFLYKGTFQFIDLGLSPGGTLMLDTGLSLLFFIQHSIMIRSRFKALIQEFVHPDAYRAVYALFSGITLFTVLIFWQTTPWHAGSAHGLFRWGLRFLFFLSIIGFFWGVRVLNYFDPFGIYQIRNHLKNKQTKNVKFVANGPFRLVRHPFYFFVLVMLWSCPDLTVDRLLLNSLWTIWIILGARFEEKDLISEFGIDYQKYQQRVPMLMPFGLKAVDDRNRY